MEEASIPAKILTSPKDVGWAGYRIWLTDLMITSQSFDMTQGSKINHDK